MADHFLPGLENLSQFLTSPDISIMWNPFSPFHPPPDTLIFPHSPHQPGKNNSGVLPLINHAASSDDERVDRKRGLDCSPENVSPQGSESDNGVKRRKSSGRRKKAKGDEKEEIEPREVVHVRAKRGQATDSHSLAERVRREKINERLRCLQDIVPGCYKTMGMAVMLDEIISYVQSLQNQVEFLSMKLTAATSFYDFNSEAAALEIKAVEALKIQNSDGPRLHSPFYTNSGFYEGSNFQSYSLLE